MGEWSNGGIRDGDECRVCGADLHLNDGCEWPDDGPICYGCLTRERDEARKDTERFNWVESHPFPVVSLSTSSGRVWQVGRVAYPTLREAIDASGPPDTPPAGILPDGYGAVNAMLIEREGERG